jgi:hypothetical protein
MGAFNGMDNGAVSQLEGVQMERHMLTSRWHSLSSSSASVAATAVKASTSATAATATGSDSPSGTAASATPFDTGAASGVVPPIGGAFAVLLGIAGML